MQFKGTQNGLPSEWHWKCLSRTCIYGTCTIYHTHFPSAAEDRCLDLSMENFGISSHSIERSKTVQLTIRRIDVLRYDALLSHKPVLAIFGQICQRKILRYCCFRWSYRGNGRVKNVSLMVRLIVRDEGGQPPGFIEAICGNLFNFSNWITQNMPTWQITNHWPQKGGDAWGRWEVKFMRVFTLPLKLTNVMHYDALSLWACSGYFWTMLSALHLDSSSNTRLYNQRCWGTEKKTQKYVSSKK